MGPLAEYEAHLRAGRFMLQHCRSCGRAVFAPRLYCPACKGGDLEWRQAQGAGTVHAVTVIARPASKGGDYNVVLVELAEGARMMSRVVGVDRQDDVRIGMPVQAMITQDAAGGAPLVEFKAR